MFRRLIMAIFRLYMKYLYSTNKYSCVRRVHTLYISDFIQHNGDDEPHDYDPLTNTSQTGR